MTEAAQAVFNQIRSQIEQLNGEDLIKHLLIKLNDPNATDIEQLRRYEPWHMLLLVKWTVLYGDFSSLRKVEPVAEIHMHQLLDLTKLLSDHISEFKTLSDIHLYLRKMAYQQFWLQQRESIPFGIARQHVLFGSLEETHRFQKRFADCTGISIGDFINMSTAIFAYLLIDDSRILIMKEWFFAEAQEYGWNTIERFFDSISITTEEARSWLAEYEDDKAESFHTVAYEYFERSPFARYPLFKHGDYYFVISPTLLLHSLSTFVHDVLRNANANAFMVKFGEMFEKLLERSLRSVGLDVLTEDDLLSHFGRKPNQQVVDFLVTDSGCNIFIEAKGVVMRWEGMVAQLPHTLRNERSLRSILKAIRQAFDVASSVQAGDLICGTELGSGENYLLVVTMKEFFLGNGRALRNYVAEEKIDEIIADFGNTAPIPLENIFLVSVDELDIIVGEIAKGSLSLSQLMGAAVEKGHTFGVHPVFRELVTYSNSDIHPPPILEQATNDLLSRSAAILNKSHEQTS